MRKETQLKKFCDTSKIKYREATNQHYIYIKSKQFTGKTRKELIDKLFEHFCGISVTTLEEAFKEWMIWRRDNETNSKTLKENSNEYHNYIQGAAICSMKVSSLTITNFEAFFYEVTKTTIQKQNGSRYLSI